MTTTTTTYTQAAKTVLDDLIALAPDLRDFYTPTDVEALREWRLRIDFQHEFSFGIVWDAILLRNDEPIATIEDRGEGGCLIIRGIGTTPEEKKTHERTIDTTAQTLFPNAIEPTEAFMTVIDALSSAGVNH